MSQRTLTVVLALTLLAMIAASYAVQYSVFGKRPNFEQQLAAIEPLAEAGRWTDAEQAGKAVDRRWRKGKTLIAIKYTDSDYTMLNVTLLELLSAIKSHNTEEVRRTSRITLYLFEQITSIAPRS